MRAIITIVIVLLISILGGCAKTDDSAGTSPGAASVPSGKQLRSHAPTHATPGSHEDWCGEHQVAESLCTRCNPSLIAAFKATGDWCQGHGLPESQCLRCNPGLKLDRPQRAGGN